MCVCVCQRVDSTKMSIILCRHKGENVSYNPFICQIMQKLSENAKRQICQISSPLFTKLKKKEKSSKRILNFEQDEEMWNVDPEFRVKVTLEKAPYTHTHTHIYIYIYIRPHRTSFHKQTMEHRERRRDVIIIPEKDKKKRHSSCLQLTVISWLCLASSSLLFGWSTCIHLVSHPPST